MDSTRYHRRRLPRGVRHYGLIASVASGIGEAGSALGSYATQLGSGLESSLLGSPGSTGTMAGMTGAEGASVGVPASGGMLGQAGAYGGVAPSAGLLGSGGQLGGHQLGQSALGQAFQGQGLSGGLLSSQHGIFSGLLTGQHNMAGGLPPTAPPQSTNRGQNPFQFLQTPVQGVGMRDPRLALLSTLLQGAGNAYGRGGKGGSY